MCVLPHDVLRAGDSASYGMVEAQLKSHNRLTKGKDGWYLDGVCYRVLKELSMKYYSDADFKLKLQGYVIADNQNKGILIEHDDGRHYEPDDMEGKL